MHFQLYGVPQPSHFEALCGMRDMDQGALLSGDFIPWRRSRKILDIDAGCWRGISSSATSNVPRRREPSGALRRADAAAIHAEELGVARRSAPPAGRAHEDVRVSQPARCQRFIEALPRRLPAALAGRLRHRLSSFAYLKHLQPIR